MKQLSSLGKSVTTLLILLLTPVVARANDLASNMSLDVEVTLIDSGPFYAQLWFWVVVGLVFLFLLILLLRFGNGGKKKEPEEKG